MQEYRPSHIMRIFSSVSRGPVVVLRRPGDTLPCLNNALLGKHEAFVQTLNKGEVGVLVPL